MSIENVIAAEVIAETAPAIVAEVIAETAPAIVAVVEPIKVSSVFMNRNVLIGVGVVTGVVAVGVGVRWLFRRQKSRRVQVAEVTLTNSAVEGSAAA